MSHDEPSSKRALGLSENAYETAAKSVLITAAIALLVAALFFIPRLAGAFWPFTATKAAEPALVHNANMPLLKAASHSDPNPSKGGQSIAMTGGSALIASTGLEGTIADIEKSSNSGRISLYVVREGDTLSDIADMFDVSGNTILWANDLKSAGSIHPGDTLLILPVSGLRYTVKKGETLAGIAKAYDADAEEIASYNGLAAGSSLSAGTEIIIPGGELPVAKPAAKKTATASKSSGSTSRSLPAISGFFGNPLPGGRLTQGLHGTNGVDIGAPSGTPIYAAAGGTIIVARNNGAYNGGYGNYVVIDHGNGTQTLYAHMTRTAVGGGAVGKGELIGYVGNTGRSTGNHLHFEVRGAKNPFAN